jgi:hypothetical protein
LEREAKKKTTAAATAWKAEPERAQAERESKQMPPTKKPKPGPKEETAFTTTKDGPVKGVLSSMANDIISDLDNKRELRIPFDEIPQDVKDEVQNELAMRYAQEQASMNSGHYNDPLAKVRAS